MADQVPEPEVEDVEAQDEQVDTNVAEEDNTQEPTASAPAETAEYENPADAAGGYADVPAQSDEEEWLMKVNGCLVALVVASCAELAQAVRYCDKWRPDPLKCDGAFAFAIAVGATSLAINFLFAGGLYFRREMLKGFAAYLSIVNVLLWGFAVAVCTFSEPFNTTGNGYFATWGAAIISVYFAQISFEKFNALLGKTFTNALSGTIERRVMMMTMILSFVFAFSALTNKQNEFPTRFTSQEKWGFACGMTSGGLIVVYMLLKAFTNMVTGNTIIKYISYLLVVLWLFGVGVCTFDAPFITTGNGYFTAWGSFLTSIYLAYLLTVSPTAETPAAQ